MCYVYSFDLRGNIQNSLISANINNENGKENIIFSRNYFFLNSKQKKYNSNKL